MKDKKAILDEAIQELSESDEALYWELGVALSGEYVSKDILFELDYLEAGKELWEGFLYEAYGILCDRKEKVQREWLKELTSGDLKDTLQAIIIALSVRYEVSLSIAIPIAVLVVKKGLNKFCSATPTKRPKRTFSQILKDQKKHAKEIEGMR